MAVRLAYDLGLHTSTKRYVDEGSMTPEEANARNVAIWGCFMNDRYVELHVCMLGFADYVPVKRMRSLPRSTIPYQCQRHRE